MRNRKKREAKKQRKMRERIRGKKYPGIYLGCIAATQKTVVGKSAYGMYIVKRTDEIFWLKNATGGRAMVRK